MKSKVKEITYLGSNGLFINGDKYGMGITRVIIDGPNEIKIYVTPWYKKIKDYEDFHKIKELNKYENVSIIEDEE